MTERINEILDTLPKLPGIYMMKDGNGEILYIGKAKSLFSRVRSYFQDSRNLMPRSRAMIAKIKDIKTGTGIPKISPCPNQVKDSGNP